MYSWSLSLNGKRVGHLPGNKLRYSGPGIAVLRCLYRLLQVQASDRNEREENRRTSRFPPLFHVHSHGISQTGCLCCGSTFMNRTGLSAMTRLSLRIPRRGQKMRDIPPQSSLLLSDARRGIAWNGSKMSANPGCLMVHQYLPVNGQNRDDNV